MLAALCLAATEDKAQGLYSVTVIHHVSALGQAGVINPADILVSCITLYNEKIITAFIKCLVLSLLLP